jgi:hypothetical protein
MNDNREKLSTDADRRLHRMVKELRADFNRVQQLLGTELAVGVIAEIADEIMSGIRDIADFIEAAPPKSNTNELNKLCGFYDSVQKTLKVRMGELLDTTEVSLPSPAVFMEPVLSNSKGAELYDMRRNSHYELLQAPGIADTDPNVLRARDISLTPTVPPSALSLQGIPDLPLPNTINTALGEAGKLDLSTLINSNAGTLNSTLANLSSLASELAKASAQLTGEAQKQALATAGDVARQVSDIINKSLQNSASATPAAPAPKPAPPVGQQAKAEVCRELERINKGSGTPQEKREKKKETLGAPTTPPNPADSGEKVDYQMSVVLLDENNIPYTQGRLKIGMSFFEFDTPVEFNGGVFIDMEDGEFFFPEKIRLTKGRKGSIRITADLDGVKISGIKNFELPDKPDITFQCKMLSETRKITETNARTAMDEAIKNTSFGVDTSPLLELFLNGGIELPFKLFTVNADGGGKGKVDARFEYKKAESGTIGSSTSDTTVTEFEVVIPKNGWAITIE